MVEELGRIIIDQMQAGDESAYETILDHHLTPISNYVNRMMGQATESEDIVQETFMRLWTNRQKFDPTRVKLTTWLHRIAHNLCIDEFRKTKPVGNDTETPITNGPDQALTTEQNSEQVRRALMQLSEHQRSALVLYHYQELPQKEVARILEMSTNAVESLLRRSREQLKLALVAMEGV